MTCFRHVADEESRMMLTVKTRTAEGDRQQRNIYINWLEGKEQSVMEMLDKDGFEALDGGLRIWNEPKGDTDITIMKRRQLRFKDPDGYIWEIDDSSKAR